MAILNNFGTKFMKLYVENIRTNKSVRLLSEFYGFTLCT